MPAPNALFCHMPLFPAAQACQGYPESGVCDAATWRFLLGQDAEPADLAQLQTGESDDEDLAQQVGRQGVQVVHSGGRRCWRAGWGTGGCSLQGGDATAASLPLPCSGAGLALPPPACRTATACG